MNILSRLLVCGLLILWPVTSSALVALGDYPDDATVYCPVNTNDQTGASITMSTNPTVVVYKGDTTTTEVTTGVTLAEDFDTETGVHLVTIATTDAFYATGQEYTVVAKDAVIDTKAASAALCTFSIERAGGVLALIKAGLTVIPDLDAATGTIGPGQLEDGLVTASKITAAALNGKGDWNIGKTGYSLTDAEKKKLGFAGTVTISSINTWVTDGGVNYGNQVTITNSGFITADQAFAGYYLCTSANVCYQISGSVAATATFIVSQDHYIPSTTTGNLDVRAR